MTCFAGNSFVDTEPEKFKLFILNKKNELNNNNIKL